VQPQPRGEVARIIHQTWATRDSIPLEFESYMQSWLKHHPKWEYRFWADDDNNKLVSRHFPWFQDTFNQLTGGMPGFVTRPKIRQADAIRYMILHVYGGVYADLDFEALKPLEDILDGSRDAIIGQEPFAHAHLLNGQPRTVCNAIMISPRGHPFWVKVLEYIRDHTRHQGDPVDSTGPRMLERVLKEYETSPQGKERPVWVAPPELLYPQWNQGELDHLKQICGRGGGTAEAQSTCKQLIKTQYSNDVPRGALAVHHWSHTWLETDQGKTSALSKILKNYQSQIATGSV